MASLVVGEVSSPSSSARNLKDELASLKIERGHSRETGGSRTSGGGRRTGPGLWLRLLTLLLWMIPIGLLAGAGYYGYSQFLRLRNKPLVTTASVQYMTTAEAEKLLSAKGYIKSRHQAMIGAKAPGRVKEMHVEEGMRVKEGDLLAVLEHDDLKAQLEAKQAWVARSKADLEEAAADLDEKQRKADRYTQLRARNQVADEDFDAAVGAARRCKARISSLEAAIKLQEAGIRETQATINDMIIRAPFDGTIVTKEADRGETITPGGMGAASGRGSVATVADLSQLDVETDVAENMMARVSVGQPAEISVSAVPGKRYRGEVRQIIPMGDRARGTVRVKVKILEPDKYLFPELVSTVHFLPTAKRDEADRKGEFIFAPKGAIREEAGHAFAWVIDPTGRVRKQKVEVVISNDLARVEKGLAPGMTVVINPPPNLRDGEEVKVAD